MDKKTKLIHSKNMLICKILWVALLLDIVTNVALLRFDFLLRHFPAPAALAMCVISTLLANRKKMVTQTMYIIAGMVFVYLYIILLTNPKLSNFPFVLFGIVLFSIYQNTKLILLSGSIAVIFTNFFFYTFRERIFLGADIYSAAMFSLVCILITIVLFFNARFTERLRHKAERNESEAIDELKRNKEYLESFIDNTSDAIEVNDLEGNVQMVNKAFESIYGWKAEEVVNRPLRNIPGDRLEELNEIWTKVWLGSKVPGVETKRLTSQGLLIDVSVTISPIRDAEGKTVALSSISRDITEKIKTEELLRKSDKLSVLGQLAAGVAHEIRNPLTVIKGFLQLMDTRKSVNNDFFPTILQEVDRIESIISEFLLLAKPQLTFVQETDLKTLLSTVVVLLDTQAIMNNYQLSLEMAEDIPLIECDQNQIKQVYINIVKNAMEAMPLGGPIAISLKAGNADNVVVCISDSGNGIPAELIPRIGEPFYTTKDDGTGLGLMVSFKIIENHHGSINISSVVGEGTTFEISLPVTQN